MVIGFMVEIFKDRFVEFGMTETLGANLGWVAAALVIVLLAIISNFIAKRFLLRPLPILSKRAVQDGMTSCINTRFLSDYLIWRPLW